MTRNIGEKPLSFRYFIRTALISAGMTFILFMASLAWSYFYSAVTEKLCPIPPPSQFFAIPLYMSEFLIYALLLNILVDYFSWSTTQLGLKLVVNSSGRSSLLIVIFAPLVMFVTLYCIYCVYLPLSIFWDLRQEGWTLPFGTLVRIGKSNLVNIFHSMSPPSTLFVLACQGGSPTTFAISAISTSRILGVETIIPFVLLFVSCAFGVLAYTTRPLTQKPISFVIERMDSSGQRVTALLIGFLGGISALVLAILALIKFLKPIAQIYL
jgi:hypothetical protein